MLRGGWHVASNDSTSKTIIVAAILCVVCSVVVSTAAVQLRPAQKANKALDFNKNILAAAGILEDGIPVSTQFEKVTTKVIDLSTGKYTDAVDVKTFDQRKAAKDPKLSDVLSSDIDIAGLSRLEKYANVYLVEEKGALSKVILPIRGYGLWSTLRGFIALEADLNTVAGLGYYEHGETPGLGGEVDNPKWKGIWLGKKVYTGDGNVALSVIKGAVTGATADAEYKIDGLSGATLTSDGVDYMVKFWLGENGFKPFLQNLKNGEA